MHGKFYFAGPGVTIPGTSFGVTAALFHLWLKPTGLPFKGYTTATSEGLLGVAAIETPIVEFITTDLGDEEPFFELHGSVLDVTINPSTFLIDSGIATITLKKITNSGIPDPTLSFTSDACRGFSAVVGSIHFRATLITLPANQQDPTGMTIINI